MNRLSVLMVAGITALIVGKASAQITVNAGSIPGPGVSVWVVEVYDVSVNAGSGGANQVWTVPDYSWDDSGHVDVVAPSATPFEADFPTATRVLKQAITGDGVPGFSYLYERITDGSYTRLGMGSQIGDSLMLVSYDAPVLEFPLPLTSTSSWTSVERQFIEIIPGMVITLTDSAIRTVDGWGTIHTPFGSKQVLRVFSHHYEIMEMSGLPPDQSEDASYTWVDAQGIPVVQFESDEETGNPNFTSGSVLLVGFAPPAAAEPVRGPVADAFAVGQNYPNPFNPTTTLPMEMAHGGRVTLDIYDETGRLVSHDDYDLTAGHHDLAINGVNWATGTYFAQVMAAAQTQTVKMLLMK